MSSSIKKKDGGSRKRQMKPQLTGTERARYHIDNMERMLEASDKLNGVMGTMLGALGGNISPDSGLGLDDVESPDDDIDPLSLPNFMRNERSLQKSIIRQSRLHNKKLLDKKDVAKREQEREKKMARRSDERPELSRSDMAKVIKIMMKLGGPHMQRHEDLQLIADAKEEDIEEKMESSNVSDFYCFSKSRVQVAVNKLGQLMQRVDDGFFNQEPLQLADVPFVDRMKILRMYYDNNELQGTHASPLKVKTEWFVLTINNYMTEKDPEWKPTKAFRGILRNAREKVKEEKD